MKIQTLNTEVGGRQARSVLDCGGPPLLLHRGRAQASQSARGLAQSKTWRIFGALLAAFALIGSVHAQSYSIDW